MIKFWSLTSHLILAQVNIQSSLLDCSFNRFHFFILLLGSFFWFFVANRVNGDDFIRASTTYFRVWDCNDRLRLNWLRFTSVALQENRSWDFNRLGSDFNTLNRLCVFFLQPLLHDWLKHFVWKQGFQSVDGLLLRFYLTHLESFSHLHGDVRPCLVYDHALRKSKLWLSFRLQFQCKIV